MKDKRTPEFRAYWAAKMRCENPRVRNYNSYGGRGVQFCFADFDQFLADVGRRPSDDHSLDRIDNNRNYEPGNLRWATRTEQCLNRRKFLRGESRADTTSGYAGVSFSKSKSKWKAYYTINGRQHHVGYFPTAALASAAREAAVKTTKLPVVLGGAIREPIAA